MYVIQVRNVNEAYAELEPLLHCPENWHEIAPRGLRTMEFGEPVTTVYTHPTERVLFDPARDANPFFHLMEALWIIAGRRDVKFIANFLPSIAEFSDDGEEFNAAYGFRLREHFGLDQIKRVINLLRKDPDSRRAYFVIADPLDLSYHTKDVPCNVAVFFKLRDHQLNMLVANRSNDVVWGAYGANAVQFSMLQELVAAGIGAEVGTYTQVSDSFHVYTDNPKVQNLLKGGVMTRDPYASGDATTYPLMGPGGNTDLWVDEAEDWVEAYPEVLVPCDPYFREVVSPMVRAFNAHRRLKDTKRALEIIETSPAYLDKVDWLVAAHAWLTRRLTA